MPHLGAEICCDLEVALLWREGEVDAVCWNGFRPDGSSGSHFDEITTWLYAKLNTGG